MWIACAFKNLCRIGTTLSAAVVLSACTTVEGGPDRLYSVADEMAFARTQLEGRDGTDGIVARYYTSNSDIDRMHWRNEIIARRMYIIDVQYSQYEAALTSDRQKFGFLTATAANGLGIASTLTTPVRSAQLLAGIGSAIGATRGSFDSEIVFTKALQIMQAQMRSLRDTVGRRILQRRGESAVTYPMSAALSDLEDYYRAGTLNSGLIKAAGDAGEAAQVAAEDKALVVTYGTDASTQALKACLNSPGVKAEQLVALLPSRSRAEFASLLVDTSGDTFTRRQILLQKARAGGICP